MPVPPNKREKRTGADCPLSSCCITVPPTAERGSYNCPAEQEKENRGGLSPVLLLCHRPAARLILVLLAFICASGEKLS